MPVGEPGWPLRRPSHNRRGRYARPRLESSEHLRRGAACNRGPRRTGCPAEYSAGPREKPAPTNCGEQRQATPRGLRLEKFAAAPETCLHLGGQTERASEPSGYEADAVLSVHRQEETSADKEGADNAWAEKASADRDSPATG